MAGAPTLFHRVTPGNRMREELELTSFVAKNIVGSTSVFFLQALLPSLSPLCISLTVLYYLPMETARRCYNDTLTSLPCEPPLWDPCCFSAQMAPVITIKQMQQQMCYYPPSDRQNSIFCRTLLPCKFPHPNHLTASVYLQRLR